MEDQKPQQSGKFDKKDIFSVPEGYFESFEARVASRIGRQDEKKVVQMRPSQVWKWGLAAAAAIAVLVIFIPGLYRSEAPSADDLLSELPADQCLAYLKQSDLELTDILLIEDLDGLIEDVEGLPLQENALDTNDADLLYERYGVTDDEKLQTL